MVFDWSCVASDIEVLGNVVARMVEGIERRRLTGALAVALIIPRRSSGIGCSAEDSLISSGRVRLW